MKIFKTIWNFIKKYKKNILTVLLITILITIFRFPGSEIVNKLAREVTQSLPFQMDFQKTQIDLIPPRLSFNNTSFYHSTLSEPFDLDKVSIALALSRWLAFNQGWKISFKKESSELSLLIAFKNKTRDKVKKKLLNLYGQSSFFSLSLLRPFFPYLQISGVTNFSFELEGPIKNLITGKGMFQLQGKQVESKATQINSAMGPLNLPHIKWKNIDIEFQLKDNQILIKKFLLGTKSHPLFVNLRGYLELNLYRNRLRIENYDIQTLIEVSKDFQLPLLDLMLLKTKEQTLRGVKYTARITGNPSKAPNIEKLSEF